MSKHTSAPIGVHVLRLRYRFWLLATTWARRRLARAQETAKAGR